MTIYVRHAVLTIDLCSFDNGLEIKGDIEVYITNCVFSGNSNGYCVKSPSKAGLCGNCDEEILEYLCETCKSKSSAENQ